MNIVYHAILFISSVRCEQRSPERNLEQNAFNYQPNLIKMSPRQDGKPQYDNIQPNSYRRIDPESNYGRLYPEEPSNLKNRIPEYSILSSRLNDNNINPYSGNNNNLATYSRSDDNIRPNAWPRDNKESLTNLYHNNNYKAAQYILLDDKRMDSPYARSFDDMIRRAHDNYDDFRKRNNNIPNSRVYNNYRSPNSYNNIPRNIRFNQNKDNRSNLRPLNNNVPQIASKYYGRNIAPETRLYKNEMGKIMQKYPNDMASKLPYMPRPGLRNTGNNLYPNPYPYDKKMTSESLFNKDYMKRNSRSNDNSIVSNSVPYDSDKDQNSRASIINNYPHQDDKIGLGLRAYENIGIMNTQLYNMALNAHRNAEHRAPELRPDNKNIVGKDREKEQQLEYINNMDPNSHSYDSKIPYMFGNALETRSLDNKMTFNSPKYTNNIPQYALNYNNSIIPNYGLYNIDNASAVTSFDKNMTLYSSVYDENVLHNLQNHDEAPNFGPYNSTVTNTHPIEYNYNTLLKVSNINQTVRFDDNDNTVIYENRVVPNLEQQYTGKIYELEKERSNLMASNGQQDINAMPVAAKSPINLDLNIRLPSMTPRIDPFTPHLYETTVREFQHLEKELPPVASNLIESYIANTIGSIIDTKEPQLASDNINKNLSVTQSLNQEADLKRENNENVFDQITEQKEGINTQNQNDLVQTTILNTNDTKEPDPLVQTVQTFYRVPKRKYYELKITTDISIIQKPALNISAEVSESDSIESSNRDSTITQTQEIKLLPNKSQNTTLQSKYNDTDSIYPKLVEETYDFYPNTSNSSTVMNLNKDKSNNSVLSETSNNSRPESIQANHSSLPINDMQVQRNNQTLINLNEINTLPKHNNTVLKLYNVPPNLGKDTFQAHQYYDGPPMQYGRSYRNMVPSYSKDTNLLRYQNFYSPTIGIPNSLPAQYNNRFLQDMKPVYKPNAFNSPQDRNRMQYYNNNFGVSHRYGYNPIYAANRGKYSSKQAYSTNSYLKKMNAAKYRNNKRRPHYSYGHRYGETKHKKHMFYKKPHSLYGDLKRHHRYGEAIAPVSFRKHHQKHHHRLDKESRKHNGQLSNLTHSAPKTSGINRQKQVENSKAFFKKKMHYMVDKHGSKNVHERIDSWCAQCTSDGPEAWCGCSRSCADSIKGWEFDDFKTNFLRQRSLASIFRCRWRKFIHDNVWYIRETFRNLFGAKMKPYRGGEPKIWVPAANGRVPLGAFQAGHADDEYRVYIARAKFGDDLVPGVLYDYDDCALINVDGTEHCVNNYEILTGQSYKWLYVDSSQKWFNWHPDRIVSSVKGVNFGFCRLPYGEDGRYWHISTHHPFRGCVVAKKYESHFKSTIMTKDYSILLF